MKLNVSHQFLPKTRSVHAAIVQDFFGIGFETGDYTIANDLELPVQNGDTVLFTGPSGSGKSSLMRAVGEQLDADPMQNVVWADTLALGDRILVDALELPLRETLELLSACGLGEARLLLRTPAELSDGQRYRFRLALALSQKPSWVVADEFSATLDRTLARVIAFNIQRLAKRLNVGFLLATTHEDIVADLAPSLHVQCQLNGRVEFIEQRESYISPQISFYEELTIREGTAGDWPSFAHWHYRSHHLGFVRKVFVLEHAGEPIGICVFCSPARSLRPRNQFFQQSGSWSRLSLKTLNAQLVTLSRVVMHPVYRGAGVSRWFIRESCQRCPWPWIEALAQMGHLNPFLEKAGFVRVGVGAGGVRSHQAHAALYGGGRKHNGRHNRLTQETHEKSR